MTPQERQLVDDLFDRLAKVEGSPRDGEAVAVMQEGLRRAPNALYALVQTVLVQDEALKRANARIQDLEQAQAQAGEQRQSGGFLDSMREAVFGKDTQPHGSVPNVPPPPSNRPVWNSGQVLQQQPQGGRYDQGYGGAPYPPYGQGYGQGGFAPPFGGGGGSFLGTAAAAATGVVGGSLLLSGIRSMMGGSHHQAFGDTTIINEGGASPWGNQSGSSMASDAGINDIGRSDTASGSGLFDQAALDRQQDAEQDAEFDQAELDRQQDAQQDAEEDFGSDDYGNDDDGSDYA
jgi:hypothetical protein